MSRTYLPLNASNARVRAAEEARRNRTEIVRELSWGRVSRRELFKMGLFTGAGMLAPLRGLNPFVASASAQATGVPRSPLFGCEPFTQPMPRFDVLPRNHPSCLTPAPTAFANETRVPVDPRLGGGSGPIEGRPPGPVWAHQRFGEFAPAVAVEAVTTSCTGNYRYSPQVPSSLNCGIDPAYGVPMRFDPQLPIQYGDALWMFNGSAPPKLLQARYGEPVLFRHHNKLPVDVRSNGGFGRHTLTTHEHNGHHGAENDGFTGAFFFPNQYYDYHWPMVLAGHFSVNAAASDRRASTPDGSGGLINIPGDWRETMSTHWFHDHMFGFTAQNVYKGNAAMLNIYSGLDRGNEEIDDDVNLRLPSGTTKDWGNLDYDVNLMLCEKSFDRDAQLTYDIFNFDGFLGDVMTVNLVHRPYFEVERRKYRFRILNGSIARFFKIALANSSGAAMPMIQIANDGNLLPHPVTLRELDHIGVAERYDIVIDFSQYSIGEKLHLVNLADHFDDDDGELNGKKVQDDLTLAQALAGASSDPCIGRFLEFRVVRDPLKPDLSRVPDTLIPNPDLSQIPVARVRNFVFGRDARQTTFDPRTSAEGEWGTATDGGSMLAADYARISAAPKFGTREVWNLINDGGGWDHPIHIHFEEGQILARDGKFSNVPAWERGRKDVYRLRPGGTVTITMQFRDWGGMFMEHCHNTSHEDNAMLLRWDIDGGGEAHLAPLPTPIPTPQGVTFVSPSETLPTARD
jgi:FtsP/CotA-like multicopper oxidase with cupredoxin domain